MLGVRNIRSLSHRVKLLDGRQVHLEEGGNLEAEKTLVFMPGSAFHIFLLHIVFLRVARTQSILLPVRVWTTLKTPRVNIFP